MFNPTSTTLPMRSKDANSRGQSLRGMVRRRTPSGRHGLHDFFSAPTPSQDPLRRYFPSFQPPRRDRFRDHNDFPTSRPTSSEESRSDSSQPTTPRLTSFQDGSVAFEQAAATMFVALKYASKECQAMEQTFNEQVHHLSLWLPPQYTDSLWILYIEWNGVPVTDSAKPPDHKPDHNVVTYEIIVTRFKTALAGLKGSGPQSVEYGEEPKLRPTWDILRTTMRKLQISVEAIEELMEIVRTQRDRMAPLVHELLAAMQLLESIRPLWDLPAAAKKQGADPMKPRKAYEWAGHRGDSE